MGIVEGINDYHKFMQDLSVATSFECLLESCRSYKKDFSLVNANYGGVFFHYTCAIKDRHMHILLSSIFKLCLLAKTYEKCAFSGNYTWLASITSSSMS